MESDVLDAVQKLRPVADAAGCSLAQLALAWCLRQPTVSSVIVGATKTRHVDDNVAAADLNLGEDVFARVDRVLESLAVEGV
jgi:aryl-alcohol dehydrogenase-like predicted oxidoreductase